MLPVNTCVVCSEPELWPRWQMYRWAVSAVVQLVAVPQCEAPEELPKATDTVARLFVLVLSFTSVGVTAPWKIEYSWPRVNVGMSATRSSCGRPCRACNP